MNGLFSLSWAEFSSNITETCKALKKCGQMTDVTLVCDDGEITAHKLILYGGSNFFKSVLTKINHQHPLIYMKGVEIKPLEAIIEFLYNGEVNIAEEDLKVLLDTADDLEVRGLSQKEKDKRINGKSELKEDSVRDNSNTVKMKDDTMDKPQTKEVTEITREIIDFESDEVTVTEDPLTRKIQEMEDQIKDIEDHIEVKNDNDVNISKLLESVKNDTSDDDEKALQLMERVTEPNGARGWNCKICGKSHIDKFRIRKHVKAQHLSLRKSEQVRRDNPQYLVSYEDIGDFVTDDEFQGKVLSLMEKSEGEDEKVIWSCTECGKNDGDKAKIRKHVEEHIGKLVFSCLLCEEKRARSNYMKRHIVLRHTSQ